MTIFIDSSAFVALRHVNDPHHKTAKQIIEVLHDSSAPITTTNFIIAEAVTVISQKASHQDAIEFYEQDLAEISIINFFGRHSRQGF